MTATLSKKLRFSDVVYAVDATPKSLRLWLQRGLVQIRTPKPESGWTEYSFIDVAILALVRAISRFGVDVEEAGKFANVIIGYAGHYVAAGYDPEVLLANHIAAMWTNRRVHISRDDDNWSLRCVSLWETEIRDLSDPLLHPETPSGRAALRREQEPAAIFMVIDVETIVRTAFQRASESVED